MTFCFIQQSKNVTTTHHIWFHGETDTYFIAQARRDDTASSSSYYFELQKWGCAQACIRHGLWARPLFEIGDPCRCACRANRSKTDRWKPELVVCLFVFFGIALNAQKRRLRASKTVTNCCNARLTHWGSQQFKFVNAEVLYACAEDHKMANSFLPYQDCVHMLA